MPVGKAEWSMRGRASQNRAVPIDTPGQDCLAVGAEGYDTDLALMDEMRVKGR